MINKKNIRKVIISIICTLVLWIGLSMFSKTNINALEIDSTSPNIQVIGAQIRTTGRQGIRFVGMVNDYNVSNVTSFGIAIAYGKVEVSESFYAGGEVNNKTVLSATVSALDDTGYFYITLYGIPDSAFIQNVTARAYVVDDGRNVYSTSVTVRSLIEVAESAKSFGNNTLLVNDVINYVNTNYKKVYTDNENNIIMDNAVYENRLSEITELFLADYNQSMDTNYLTLDDFAQNTRGGFSDTFTKEQVEADKLYVFYNKNNKQMMTKWGWLLDNLYQEINENSFTDEQIKLLKGESTTYTNWWGARHLLSAIVGFLTKTKYGTLGFSSVPDFSLEKYNSLYDSINNVVYATGKVDRVKVGSTYSLPIITSTQNGYKGVWSDGTNSFDGDYIITNSDIKLVKDIELINYNITYYDGATALTIEGALTSYTIESDDITLPVYSKEGYSFDGWYTTSVLTGSNVTSITSGSTGDKVFYAKTTISTPVNNSVTYNLNGGKWTSDMFNTFTPVKELTISSKNDSTGQTLTFTNSKTVTYTYFYKLYIKYDASTLSYIVVGYNAANQKISDYTGADYDYVIMVHSGCLDTTAFTYLNSSALLQEKLGMYILFDSDIASYTTGNLTLNLYNSSDVTSNKTVTLINNTVLPTGITKDGYSFDGWKSSVDNLIHTNYPGYVSNIGGITYTAQWSTASIDVLELIDNVSAVVTSTTVDSLPTTVDGITLNWTSTNNNLYTIENNTGHTNRLYQTHKKQYATITLKVNISGTEYTRTKNITINPVLFDTMVNPKAVYFSVSSTSHYLTNNTRYINDQTMFSTKFKENMDMVYYAFAVPQSDGSLTLDKRYLDEVKALKNNGIRVLLVIDGANEAPLQAMVQLCNNDETRATFVNNIMTLVKDNNFDGVDVDWEFPGTSGLEGFTTEIDQVNLNKLLRDLRSAMTDYQDLGGSSYILSVAIPATSWGSVRYDFVGNSSLGGIDDYCDYVNMMSYDLNQTSFTSHVASHYATTMTNGFKFGTVYGTDRFVELGLTKSKIILGTAAYGKAYGITTTINNSATYPGLDLSARLCKINGLNSSYTSGTLYYSTINSLLSNTNYNKYKEMNGSNIVGSYLLSSSDVSYTYVVNKVSYTAEGRIFITYDSSEAIKAKCEYAKANGLGIMVWAYGEDATDTLVNTICDNLR